MADSEQSKSWFKAPKPYFIFGPCSAESMEQMRTTAQGISDAFGQVTFRAGLWKPRTKPNTFEGVGKEGLQWLKNIKDEFGFNITTEVASPKHVEECLKADVDVLWIGARTTGNPFSVQEIAEALRGVSIPVLIKNPLNPDLGLWLGAVERIEQATPNSEIGVIHRGFQLPSNKPYRNYPQWNMAINLKADYPDLPMICDASHISGTPGLIPHVLQKAYDLDMEGFMVETHYNPEVALSDKQQQITPAQLREIIDQLVPKKPQSANKDFRDKLGELRDEIDQIDDNLLEELARRMELAKEIGDYKKENNVTVLQVGRWNEILSRALRQGKALSLSERFIHDLLQSIHDESIRQQTGD